LTPTEELLVGCVLLVLSWEWFWETTGAIWDIWHNWRGVVGTVVAVLGPWFIVSAWMRRLLTEPFERGDRVRPTRDFENVPEGSVGIVTGFTHTYSVTILKWGSAERESHEIPTEYLEEG
jgi:hypothetical protein